MLHNKYFLKTCLIVAILLVSALDANLFAQIGLPDDGTVDDVPEASITGFIAVAMAIGSYLGFRNLKDK